MFTYFSSDQLISNLEKVYVGIDGMANQKIKAFT